MPVTGQRLLDLPYMWNQKSNSSEQRELWYQGLMGGDIVQRIQISVRSNKFKRSVAEHGTLVNHNSILEN
jgi:hypothetical protein